MTDNKNKSQPQPKNVFSLTIFYFEPFRMEYYSSSSSDDEDNDGILKQAFEVQISRDFNPNSTPRDGKNSVNYDRLFCKSVLGHEFLQHVIYERKKCKKLVTSDVNPDNYIKNRTILLKLVISLVFYL